MIPKGKYPVRAIEGAIVTKKSGAVGVDVIVELAEGEHAGERLRWYGHLINKDGTNSEYAQRVLESLRYLGWRTDDLADLAGLGEGTAIAVVEHKPATDGSGKVFAEVTWINALGSGAKIADEQRVTGSAAKQLGQRFAALARGVPKAGAKPANGARSGGIGRGPSDEDLAAAFGDGDTF
jgi:hypothetical protein